MAVNTRGKQTIDPPMPSVVEVELRKGKEIVAVSGELVHKAVKQV